MPWWFWIITHVWVACSTFMLIHFIENEEFEKSDSRLMTAFLVLMIIFAPITVTIALIAFIIDETPFQEWLVMKIEKFAESRFCKWIIRKIERFMERKERKKDFKDIEENEDEWNIERTGIKLK